MPEQPEHLSWRRLRCSLPIGWTLREIPERQSVAVFRPEDSSMLETALLFAGATEHRALPGQSLRDLIKEITFRRTHVALELESDRIANLDALRVDWTDGINDIVSWFVPVADVCYELAASSRALPVSVGSAEGLGRFVFAYLRIDEDAV